MRIALMPAVVEEIARVIRTMIAEDQERRQVVEPPPDPESYGWHAYAPIGSDRPPFQPPRPWADVELIDAAVAGSLLAITFRWLPTGQIFAHLSDLTDSADDPPMVADLIEYELRWLLRSYKWPHPDVTLTVGKVMIVTSLKNTP